MSLPLTEPEAREEICRVGKSLFERGYVHATAGNISVRLEDSAGGGFLMTPTDACLGHLNPATLSRLDAEGRQTSGARASKSWALHRQIYQATCRFDPGTRCIIHTHSSYCVAATLLVSGSSGSGHSGGNGGKELLPALTPYFVMKVGHVPIVPYHRPGDPAAATLAASTVARYGEAGTPIRAVMLERLGPNVWHESPAAAMAVLEELEETAKLWHLCHASGLPLPVALDAAQISELRQTFGARW